MGDEGKGKGQSSKSEQELERDLLVQNFLTVDVVQHQKVLRAVIFRRQPPAAVLVLTMQVQNAMVGAFVGKQVCLQAKQRSESWECVNDMTKYRGQLLRKQVIL